MGGECCWFFIQCRAGILYPGTFHRAARKSCETLCVCEVCVGGVCVYFFFCWFGTNKGIFPWRQRVYG